MCKLTDKFANIDKMIQERLQNAGDGGEDDVIDDEQIENAQVAGSLKERNQASEVQEVVFTPKELKVALSAGQEAKILQMLQTSNTPSINMKKVPTEALFINWESVLQYVFRTSDMEGIGPYTQGYYVPQDSKGALDMSECNLVHCMIA